MSLLLAGQAHGQVPTVSTNVEATPVQAKPALQQRSEHIQIEDSGAVIDEVRVGGVTKSISVQPKDGLPAYQLAPVSGERSWKILGF